MPRAIALVLDEDVEGRGAWLDVEAIVSEAELVEDPLGRRPCAEERFGRERDVAVHADLPGNSRAAARRVLVHRRMTPITSWRTPRLACAAAIALALCIPMGASAQTGLDGRAVFFEGPVVVPRGEHLSELVVFEGPTRVNGAVSGDVVALGGDVDVVGRVGGDVVALSGAVRLGPSARVGGDVRGAQGTSMADGAQVGGTVRAIEAERVGLGAPILGWLGGWLLMTLAAGLLALLLHWLVPQRAKDATYTTARTDPWKSLGVGALIAVGLPLVALLAMITVIGIPIGIATLLASALLAFLGFVVGGFVFGRAIAERSRRGARWSALASGIVGIAILCALALIPVIGTLVWIVASCIGVGAATLAVWRTQRPRVRRPTPAPRRPEPPPHATPPLEHPAGA